MVRDPNMYYVTFSISIYHFSLSHAEQDPTLSDSSADDEGDVAMTWESEAVPLAKGDFGSFIRTLIQHVNVIGNYIFGKISC